MFTYTVVLNVKNKLYRRVMTRTEATIKIFVK